mgnify:CR=1 FL=1
MSGKLKLLEKILSKKNILILEGGYNEEHEVSLSTAKEVKKAALELNHNLQSILVDPINFFNKIKKFKVDICFNALHGSFGEDGKIQQILFNNKIRFTHSGAKASGVAFNKFLTKKAIEKNGIKYLKSILIKKFELNENLLKNFYQKLGPLIIKPVSSGSSYGVQLIKSLEDIKFFFEIISGNKKLYENHEKLMVEPYVYGKELTVAVLEEDGKSKAIEVTEIVSKNLFFDYQAKYTKGFSKHILPANIPNQVYQQCLDNAKIVHDILGCRGVSRSDFLYDEINKKLYFLEINTQPGLTPISLVPEQLNFHNIDFTTLIDKLIKSSSCQE